MSGLLRYLGPRPVAALVITAVTIVVVGGVLFATTTVACGPAQKAGMNLHQCARTVASHQSPSPAGFPNASPLPSQAPYTPPASEPYNPPSSGPYNPPSSGYCPPDSGPYCPGSSGPYPPQGPGPASGSYPPFNPPSTGPNGLAIPTYNLSCRLPIYAAGSGSGGFIVFPGGTFIADPTSAVNLPTPPSGSPPPQPQGPGVVFYGLTYDAALSTWLPVPHAWMSPDGAHYAFPSNSSIYVVDVKSKTLTQVGEGHSWAMVGVGNDAVYAEVSGQAGLWKLPFSGSSSEVTAQGFWQQASTTAAYGTATSAVPPGVTNTIIQVNLSTGSVNGNFFSREGTSSSVVGFDAQGDPLVSVSYFAPGGGTEVWLVRSSGPTPLFGSGSYGQGQTLQGTPLPDSHGIWMPLYIQTYQGGTGIALDVPNSGLYWMSNYSGQLAGGCS